ncbi:MAG: nitrile hydratase accessory protein [Actinomycetota bacterium]
MRPPAEPEQPFAEPWHAELFATTHALARAGAFAWSEWSDAFAAAVAADHAAGGATDGSGYYEIWLGALEGFLVERGMADDGALAELRQAWTDAYLSTPHGAPVELDRGRP